jgi:hypothetical protein
MILPIANTAYVADEMNMNIEYWWNDSDNRKLKSWRKLVPVPLCPP